MSFSKFLGKNRKQYFNDHTSNVDLSFVHSLRYIRGLHEVSSTTHAWAPESTGRRWFNAKSKSNRMFRFNYTRPVKTFGWPKWTRITSILVCEAFPFSVCHFEENDGKKSLTNFFSTQLSSLPAGRRVRIVHFRRHRTAHTKSHNRDSQRLYIPSYPFHNCRSVVVIAKCCASNKMPHWVN